MQRHEQTLISKRPTGRERNIRGFAVVSLTARDKNCTPPPPLYPPSDTRKTGELDGLPHAHFHMGPDAHVACRMQPPGPCIQAIFVVTCGHMVQVSGLHSSLSLSLQSLLLLQTLSLHTTLVQTPCVPS